MSLMHEYDAAKRREYYLRTRKLKGRDGGISANDVSVGVPKKQPTTKKPPAKKTHAQKQKELAARITKLKARLEQLQAALKLLVEAAQKRSGIDKNAAEKNALAKYERSPRKDPTSKYEKKTQKQKDAAAKAAEKYRDKNQSLEDQVKDLNNKIKSIRERIARIQKTGSVRASNSTTK